MVEEIVIDSDAIAHVVSVGGEDLLRHLVDIFESMVPERLSSARRSMERGDLDSVYQEAHALRSAAGNLGAVKVASLAAALELRAKSGETEGLDKLLHALEERVIQSREMLRNRVSEAGTTGEPLALGAVPQASSDLLNIMLVEDSPDSRVLIETILRSTYSVTSFDNGNDALVAMLAAAPDLLILDISLPGMDGIQILKRVRAEGSLQHLPVIAVTAHAMTGDRESFLEEGFDEYLSKPVDEAELHDLLSRLLQDRP